jgi:hypothetical protein
MKGRSRLEKSTTMNAPVITFGIDVRPATLEQKDAGKRLFSKLIGRARAVGAAGATVFKEKMDKVDK